MGEITLKKALDDYKTIYMPYRNFADRTRVEYQNDLQSFIEFLAQSGISRVRELGIPIIERYAAHLEQKGFASLTRKRKIVALRSFITFLYQESYIDIDIAKKIVLPLTDNITPYILTLSECNKLRNACADNPRDKAIIELLFQTGITLSELVNLTVDDIQLGEKDRGFMRVIGSRGKKERLIPLNSKAYVALKGYFDSREHTENSVFFLNRFGAALGESGVQKMLRKYLKRAGIGNASIHTLRHTFGAQHIAKGTDPKTVQDVMGLKDVRSTSIYQALAKDIVRRELQTNSI
jgi:integrase/recombinase XerD